MHTHLAGATNVTVTVPGITSQHDGLPRSPTAQREMALALAGLPPTCHSLVTTLADAAVPEVIAHQEDSVGSSLWLGARAVSPP